MLGGATIQLVLGHGSVTRKEKAGKLKPTALQRQKEEIERVDTGRGDFHGGFLGVHGDLQGYTGDFMMINGVSG
jgi:hypothetical protein